MAADPNGDSAFWSKVQHEELPHCGLCDPVTRQVELGDGRLARCPRCHPLQNALLPQVWRCPVCHALVYRDQRGLPCSVHRTVTSWHREYDAAQSGAEPLPLQNPVTEAGASQARTALAARPRPEPPPEPDPPTAAPAPPPEPEAAEEAAAEEDDFPY
jgi:hypothetical protein